ncbi:metallophosphoesterase [Candidatus Bipolaricaulota bacterium]|nr:metallophosphoesterase [Candidatus Bipolaricaulota bacterium]
MIEFLLVLVFGIGGLSAPLLYGPWTGAPQADSVVISWVSAPASSVTIQYAPLPLFQKTGEMVYSAKYSPANPEEKEIATVRLTGLSQSTWYVYRLVFPDGSSTPIGTFRTAPTSGEPVTFGVISDTQWQWTGVNRVELVAQAMALDPWAFHFVLHAGDLVETPIPSHWEFFFTSMAPILRWTPLLPVLGNHERNSLSYYQHFTLPQGGGRFGERWWSLSWGDVLVVGLDSNAKSPRDYQEQVEWMRKILSGPEPHKIVIFHHPVFSSDASYGPGSEGLQALWHPVFVELGVDLVFNGHAHNYERIERDGVTYLVVGGGGANLYPLSEERVPGSVVGVESWHFYVAVRADETGINVRVMGVAEVTKDGVFPHLKILDEFTLPYD